MKKFILIILTIAVILTFAACGDNSDGSQAGTTTTAPTQSMQALYDEATVKELLSYYETGLTSSVYDYTFKITPTSYYGEEGVKAEAYLDGAKTPEGVFMVIGSKCFVFSKEHNKYLYLTVNGAIDITPSTTVSSGTGTESTQRTQDTVNDENTAVLVERYKNYDLSVVNLKKPISDYTFEVTGTPVKGADGVTIFKVYVLDNGVYADAVFGIGTDGKDYYYDPVKDAFFVLS